MNVGNSSADFGDGSSMEEARIATRSVLFILSLVAVVGNGLVLRVIPRIAEEYMLSATKVFYVGQALADLSQSILLLTGLLLDSIGEWIHWTGPSRLIICKIVGVFIIDTVGISMLHIMLLNTDRYLLITKPMTHSRFTSKRFALFHCISVSIVSTIGLFVSVYTIEHLSGEVMIYQKCLGLCVPDVRAPGFTPIVLTVCAMHWLSMLVLVLQYGHIITISLNHLRRVTPQTSNEAEDTDNVLSRLKRNFRIIRTPFIVTFIFSCSYLPMTFIEVYHIVTGIAPDPGLHTASIVLPFTNGFFNPFVYYLTITSFREKAKNTIKNSVIKCESAC